MNKNISMWGIVNATVAPLQLKPRFDGEMADEALYGMIVKVLEDAGDGWYFIETHYNYNGYIHESNMIMNDVKAEEWKTIANNIITHSIVDVLAEPKYQSYPLEMLIRGATIHVTGNRKDEWTEIELPDTRRGWVRSAFIGTLKTTANKSNEDKLRKSLVDTAMSYLGAQYRWGGKSPLGIDCSGLCSIAYLLNGITIYRDAKLKDEYMREISLEEIKPADLLFFPGHVAMYIGNGKYVHSSGSVDGVRINSLNPDDSDYREILATTIKGVGTIF